MWPQKTSLHSALLVALATAIFACENFDDAIEFDENELLDARSGSGDGLKAIYFNGTALSDQVFERVDDNINFNWSNGSPDSRLPTNLFSVRWTGFVEAKFSEDYTFYSYADDGMKVFVNGKLIVADWSNHGPRERSGTVALEAGRRYSIKVEYYENSGGAIAQVLWSSRSQPKQVIPGSQFYTSDQVQDLCPQDPEKSEPGICGCGVPEGSCDTAKTQYEAENNTSQSGCQKATNHSGYTGTGFMDFGGNGTWIEWNKVTAASAGEYTLTFRYANGSSAERQAEIVLNGQAVASLPFARTGGWPTWKNESVQVSLRQGNNTIRVRANSGNGGPNIDHMLVIGNDSPVDNCPNDPAKTEPGECGCGVPEGTCGGDPTGENCDGEAIITASGENLPSEGMEMAFDGLTHTKWLTFADSGWIQYQFCDDGAKKINSYALTSANDCEERDPRDWRLKASNDGANWTTLDQRTNQTFSSRFEKKLFRFNNTQSYKIYRLEINSNLHPSSASATQLAELELFEGESGNNDLCPLDSKKTEPGQCGCGTPDVDSDADGTMDCDDRCPADPNKTGPGTCGCNVSEAACDRITVDRYDGDELRIGSYNTLRSSIFPKDNGDMGSNRARIEGFQRVANAVDVDIWAMQEVMYDGNDQPGRTPAGLRRYMERITGGTWYMAHHPDYQEFIFSRYPIDASGTPGRRIVWALIDVNNDNNRANDVLVLSVHFMKDNHGVEAAQFVSDVIAGKNSTIPRDITILVVGDFNNKPDEPRHVAIRNAMGVNDLRPYWLGTEDNKKTTYSYGGINYNNGAFQAPSGGNPIDYIFSRTNNHYAVTKNFILSTLILGQDVLDADGLERMDVAVDPDQAVSEGTRVHCDHFPLFVDLKPTR